jgi:acyl carrier protein
MVPWVFVVLDEMPLTANGKVDRNSLPGPDQANSWSRGEEFAAPRTATEELIAGIWAEILNLERISIFDNFFELGGHSLLATQVVSRLRACFKVEVALRNVFEFPTLAGLAESVDRAIGTQQGAMAPALQPVPRGQDLPLSFAQQRLWLADQVLAGEAVYNMPFAMRLKGKLNAFALAQAMQEIVRRHEALRTNFIAVDGQPMQVIHPARPVSVPYKDLSKLPEAERQAELERLVYEEARYPFDLAHSPLLRAALIHLDDKDNVALCSMHHIVSDGWSIGVLVKEMATLYEAFSEGRPSPLMALPIQYADFAHWQQTWLQGEVLQGHLNYWKQHLGATPPLLQLPTDHPRPSAPNYNSARKLCSIPVESSDSLKGISRREEVTMFMTLFAAFQTLLYRYTNQDDIVMGTAIANRNRAETETLIGCFVNLLALRTDLSGNPTFRELVGRVREVTLGAYAHQDLPFERLVQELHPDRDASVNPLLQVVCVYHNTPMQQLDLPGTSLSFVSRSDYNSMNFERGKIQFDLILSITDVGEGLAAIIYYRTDLFDESTIERLASQFRTLLGEIADDPDKRISDYRLISEDESHGLLPSHFPKAKLSQKDFENFLSEINEASMA